MPLFERVPQFEYIRFQLRIQDFLLGGTLMHWGVPTSNTATFWQNVCENERIDSRWGGGGGCARTPAAPPESANGFYWSFEIFERPMVIDSLNLKLGSNREILIKCDFGRD